MADGKSIASMLVGKMGAPEAEEGPDEASMVCEDILSAISAKDPAALKSALKSFMAYCNDDEPEADDEY